jgi:hypothetical protein
MKSPSLHISAGREELNARVATVMQATRALRSEVALTICKSSEIRIASRQLRMDSVRTTEGTVAWRQYLLARQAQRRLWMAQAIVKVLASQGCSAFVASAPPDSASIQ